MYKQAVLIFAAIVFISGSPLDLEAPASPDSTDLVSLGGRPFQAALISSLNTSPSGTFCSGSLIDPFWVLTAAQCVTGTDRTKVFMGKVLGLLPTYIATSYVRIIHPGWNPSNMNNDVALVRLPIPAVGPNIATIPLASPDIGTLVGVTVRASGFGLTSSTGQINDGFQVDKRAISNAECQQIYGGLIIESTICAAPLALGDSCSGDSGGPLTSGDVLVGIGSSTLMGIISWGIGCASGYPSTYARVSSARDFIDTTIAIN